MLIKDEAADVFLVFLSFVLICAFLNCGECRLFRLFGGFWDGNRQLGTGLEYQYISSTIKDHIQSHIYLLVKYLQ